MNWGVRGDQKPQCLGQWHHAGHSHFSDFDDAHRGFVAPLPDAVIKGPYGNAIWNPQQYAFIKEGAAAPGTVNPSLWRQAQLINISGLFRVTDRIYQVRNQDLSNMTMIEGKEGITVVDPLISAETAARRERRGGKSPAGRKASRAFCCQAGWPSSSILRASSCIATSRRSIFALITAGNSSLSSSSTWCPTYSVSTL